MKHQHDHPTRRPNPTTRLGNAALAAYGLLTYALFSAVFVVWFPLFVAGWPGVPSVDASLASGAPAATAAAPASPWLALAVDLGLVTLFGLQHSVMARRRFKAWWTRQVPPVAERATFVLAATLSLALLMALWQPLPGVLWEVGQPVVAALLYALAGFGFLVVVWASFAIDHFDLLGLRQIWRHLRRSQPSPPPFQTPWLYRRVRHPMQTGMLIFLWAWPRMTVSHAVLATAMTAYVLIGLWFEERDLVAHFGRRYREYRRRVPALFPGLASFTSGE
jgi:protein-S-isoprenylcysteine O-methyltransferase Ste14